jgi:plasmid stabilization system protein ParE
MSYTVLVENEANKDLQSIFKYISKNDSSVKAKKFILELSKKIESLN